MPRRDGTPTAEERLAAQRAGHGPAPATTGQGVPPAVAAAAALAATTAAAHQANTAPAVLQPVLTVPAITAAAAGIIGAFDRFLWGRRADQEEYVSGLLEAEVPDLPEDARLDVVDTELTAEQAFAAKARARLDRDLPKALSIGDRVIREAQVQKVLDRERRYMEMREGAVAVRALGEAEKRVVKQKSPGGAYWRLSPHVQQHTLDCLAMGSKVWPWSVLDVYHPPLHVGCACELVAVDQAVAAGLVGPDGFQTADQAIHALSITETHFDRDELDEELAVLEAEQRRWWKGSGRPGQFRGGREEVAAGLRRRRAARLPDFEPETVEVRDLADDDLDLRPVSVADLKADARIMVNGELRTVLAMPAPGFIRLADDGGLVHIGRDVVLGVPGPDTPEPPPEPDPADEPAAVRWTDVERLATMPAPADSGDVAAGFRFAGPGSRGRTTTDTGGTTVISEGFFRQPAAVRESVVLRRLGGRLTEALGDDGIEALQLFDASIDSGKAVTDAYVLLNSQSGPGALEERPVTMRLLIEAALEAGVPLRPEIERLADGPSVMEAAGASAS